MFNFGLKKRTAEAIRRAVRGSLMGAFLHTDEINRIDLNDDAKAYLYTESFAHHLFALGSVYSHLCQKDKFATFEFFQSAVLHGMKESRENDNGPDPFALAPILFDRFDLFQRLSREERASDEHFLLSARLVQEKDATANVGEIANILKLSTQKYMLELRKMF
jgi:hypothetical protein